MYRLIIESEGGPSREGVGNEGEREVDSLQWLGCEEVSDSAKFDREAKSEIKM